MTLDLASTKSVMSFKLGSLASFCVIVSTSLRHFSLAGRRFSSDLLDFLDGLGSQSPLTYFYSWLAISRTYAVRIGWPLITRSTYAVAILYD